MSPRRAAGRVFAATGASLLTTSAIAQSLVSIGLPPDSYNVNVTGISANGSVIVGYYYIPGSPAYDSFRSTRDGVVTELPSSPDATGGVLALGVSGDGSTIVGYQIGPLSDAQGIKWDSNGTITFLPNTPGNVRGIGIAANVDGTVLAGTEGNTPSVWPRTGGVQHLSFGFPTFGGGWAYAITPGAGTAVGSVYVSGSDRTTAAFRWSQAEGAIDLDPQGYTSKAVAVSADGSVVVGTTDRIGVYDVAFRWTAATGTVLLGNLTPGGLYSYGYGVSGDGSIVVGTTDVPGAGIRAFIWTADHGMQDLAGVLSAMGVNTNGWFLDRATGISADGRVIVGWEFVRGAFIATLPGCGSADFNHDAAVGTDTDIEDFFACVAGRCCASCESADFNGDGDVGTDADIEAFFRVLAGGSC